MNPSERLVIFADDLTGAADAAVQFAKRGLPSEVRLDGTLRASADAAVTALDLDSRSRSEDDAGRRIAALAREAGVSSNNRIFKKIDSTLRGNVRGEVRGLLDALPHSAALIAPAYPKNGRTIRGGDLYVDGRATGPSLRELFGEPLHSIGLAGVRAGSGALEDAVRRTLASGWRYVALDAETDADLASIARLYDAFPACFWVGSAGIMEHVQFLGSSAAAPQLPHIDGPLVTVAGSTHPIVAQQIDALRDGGAVTFLLDPMGMVCGASEIAAAALAAEQALRAGRDCAVALVTEATSREAFAGYARRRGWTEVEAAAAIAAALAGFAVKLSEGRATNYIATGGETARALCGRLGIDTLDVLAEVATGIPLCRARPQGTHIVTKAGGFGTRDTLLTITAALRKGDRR